jgi:uncharacterized protein YxeA
MKKILTIVTGLMLMAAVAAFAQGAAATSSQSSSTAREHKSKGAVTHQATGMISSVDTGTLVLTHKVKGKEEQTTFTINDQTHKVGDLKSGEKATVHYKVENGQNIATMVKASGTTSTASSSRPHRR